MVRIVLGRPPTDLRRTPVALARRNIEVLLTPGIFPYAASRSLNAAPQDGFFASAISISVLTRFLSIHDFVREFPSKNPSDMLRNANIQFDCMSVHPASLNVC